MGYVKNLIERLGGGYPPGPDVHVCPSCLEDEGLKKFVEAEADATSCSFCVAESHQPIAAPLVKVLLYMKECLDREYDFAENKLPYEGGYIGETWTTQELLESLLELPNDENGTLMKDLRDGLGDRQWCSNHPFSLAEDERLNFSWDEFCELVKHRRRFFFQSEELEDDELYSPLALLKELTAWCERYDLVKPFPAGSPLYRARHQKLGETLVTATELGPPPQEKTTISNRMSPPGIVMFYVSDNPETALRETATSADTFAIGKFRTRREAKILDLSEVPPIPSIFESIPDTLEYDPRPPAIFLNYFATELSKPIARDDRVHVEYIPTQIITEYFQTEFVHEGGTLDGIRYQSARHTDHCSLVLFATQDDLMDVNTNEAIEIVPAHDIWIELINRSQRDVTADELVQWDREAPQGIEWI